jgi:hypothetical protein
MEDKYPTYEEYKEYMNRENVYLYLALNSFLRKIIKEGDGDTHEADEIRNQMDPLWSKLSQDEIVFISKYNTFVVDHERKK